MSEALAKRPDLLFLDTASGAAALRSIERAVGGRDQLIATLSHAPQSSGLAYVINLIADPNSDARSLAALCKAGGISLGELLEAYKRGAYAQMQVQVVQSIATRAPAVVEDVLIRAAPHLVDCPACLGAQAIHNPDWDPKDADSPQTIPCQCTRTSSPGQITALPTVDRQKLALDVAHLLPQKGPAVVVDQRQQALIGAGAFDPSPAGFSALLADTDDILHRRRGTDSAPADPAAGVTDGELVDDDVDTE